MRKIVAVLLLLCLPAAAGWAIETFKLREHGRLEIYPVGDWKFGSEDVGEIKIVIAPKNSKDNAVGQLAVSAGGPDDFPTTEKLARHIQAAGQRMADSGEFLERKVVLKPIYQQQGFGHYFMLTDAKLVGKPSVAGDYKKICLGMIRLSPTVTVRIQLLSDGEETEAFQQLLGMVEGMELKK